MTAPIFEVDAPAVIVAPSKLPVAETVIGCS
jgi:hypothetical protein